MTSSGTKGGIAFRKKTRGSFGRLFFEMNFYQLGDSPIKWLSFFFYPVRAARPSVYIDNNMLLMGFAKPAMLPGTRS